MWTHGNPEDSQEIHREDSHRGRHWSDEPMGQEVPRTASNHQKLGKNEEEFFLGVFWRNTTLLLLLHHFSRVQLCNPTDGSPPGSSVPGILQARTLEWVAISCSNAWKWKVKVKSLSRVRLFMTPWTVTYQAPPLMGFSRQEDWSGVPCPPTQPCWHLNFRLLPS